MTNRTRDQIARAAAEAEAELAALDVDDDAVAPVRSRRQDGETSQVYSIRIPVTFSERIRVLAEARDETPSAMLRRWVLDRLEVEAAGRGAESPRSDLETLIEDALTKALERRGLLNLDVVTSSDAPGLVDPELLDPSGPVRLGKSRLHRLSGDKQHMEVAR